MSETLAAQFDQILAEQGPALRRLAAAYAWRMGEDEDLFQEICFAIWRALPSFRGECSVRTFTFRIGHNRGLTWRVRRAPARGEEGAVETLPDPRPLPSALLERAERRTRLLEAVRRLPPARREMILLSLEGLAPSEIAEVLGITANNAMVRLSRARAELRRHLLAGGEWL